MTRPNKLDDVSVAIGQIQAEIKTLFKRADEDRDTQKGHHEANQQAMGQLRDGTQSAIGELRGTATKHYDQTTRALEDLTREVKALTARPPAEIGGMSRGRLALLASIGLVTLWIIGRLIEAGFSWLITHLLNMKFGG